MIRINLLPVREKQRIRTAFVQLMLSAFLVAICVGVGFAWSYVYQDEIGDQEEKLAAAQTEINRLQKTIGEVNQLKKTREKLEKRMVVIDKLERAKTGPVRILDALASHIPKRVWLDSMSQNKGTLSLKGKGLENSDISEFMRSLGKSKYFKKINLQKTSRRQSEAGTVYEFQMKAKIDFSG
jgi:type IV pilus assembly protein PilN